MKKLSKTEIKTYQKSVPTWKLKGDAIQKTFELKDFNQAMWFVNKLARFAEEYNHHPDINIRFNKVILSLSTHDSGGLTKKDFLVAKAADTIPADLV